MKKLLFYLRVIGIVILIYILSTLQYKKLFHILLSVDLKYITIYICAFVMFAYFRALRFKLILNHYGAYPPILDVYGSTLESQYLALVTPSNIGETVKILFLNEKANVPKRVGTISYIYDRFQDLYFMVILGAISFIFVLKLPLNIYFIIFSVVIIVLFLSRNYLLTKIANKFKIEHFKRLDLKTDMILFFVNIVIYIFYFLQYYLLALALHIHISFLYLSAVSTIGTLAAIIPISISGMGVREGIFIYYLQKIHVSKESAFLLSFLDGMAFSILLTLLQHILYKLALYFLSRRKHSQIKS